MMYFSKMKSILLLFANLLLLLLFATITQSVVLEMTMSNVDETLKNNRVVFVNFYADWCHFSQQLKPIFAKASENFAHFPHGQVVWASVDCQQHAELGQRYMVNKYPTLKVFVNGELAHKEYRSTRSIDALTTFVQQQLDNSLNTFESNEDLVRRLDANKRNVIAIFAPNASIERDNYLKIAALLREDCAFWIGNQTYDSNQLIYRKTADDQQVFSGDFTSYDFMKTWLTDKCIPLVREVTFENVEELTEEGLPFLILFRLAEDAKSDAMFTDVVIRELYDLKIVNCLLADGRKFAHPLRHLGKEEADLPVLAIDSFQHMFLFPDMTQLEVPGKLRQFVLDMQSGKLHKDFHDGLLNVQAPPAHRPPPSPTDQQVPSEQPPTIVDQQQLSDDNAIGTPPVPAAFMPASSQTQLPLSVFKHLKPSDRRYSLVTKEEL